MRVTLRRAAVWKTAARDEPLIFQKNSAGIGTTNELNVGAPELLPGPTGHPRLPGFHRAGPSTPLDKSVVEYLLVAQL